MTEPAPAPPEKSKPIAAFTALDWSDEAIARERTLRIALATSRDAFRALLAAIAG
jgi:hypothetical protein